MNLLETFNTSEKLKIDFQLFDKLVTKELKQADFK